MGNHVLSFISVLGKRVKSAHRRHVVDRNAVKNADAISHAHHFKLRLPLELWLAIIDILASEDANPRHLLPLTRVCKDLNHVAEQALYRRVSVGPRLPQLYAFLHSISTDDHRAAAVRALRMQVPGVKLESVRSKGLLPPAGHSTYTPAGSHYSLDPECMDRLSSIIVQTFERLVNLQELTYNDLQTLPEVLTRTTSRLTELKTTGDGLSKATSHMHSRTVDDDRRCSSYSLLSIEKLTVDLFNPSLHLSDLYLLSVTHLSLDRCFFLALPDLRQSLPTLPNLRSLRITWSAVHANYGTSALWPTHILGDAPVPRLQRLELCEQNTQRAFEPLPTDIDARVRSHLRRIRDTCPSIKSLVWLPSDYHRRLAAGPDSRAQFCEALRQYTEGIFAAWPTLESFERPNLQVDGAFRAFVRGEGGRVSDRQSEYCEKRWRLV